MEKIYQMYGDWSIVYNQGLDIWVGYLNLKSDETYDEKRKSEKLSSLQQAIDKFEEGKKKMKPIAIIHRDAGYGGRITFEKGFTVTSVDFDDHSYRVSKKVRGTVSSSKKNFYGSHLFILDTPKNHEIIENIAVKTVEIEKIRAEIDLLEKDFERVDIVTLKPIPSQE